MNVVRIDLRKCNLFKVLARDILEWPKQNSCSRSQHCYDKALMMIDEEEVFTSMRSSFLIRIRLILNNFRL